MGEINIAGPKRANKKFGSPSAVARPSAQNSQGRNGQGSSGEAATRGFRRGKERKAVLALLGLNGLGHEGRRRDCFSLFTLFIHFFNKHLGVFDERIEHRSGRFALRFGGGVSRFLFHPHVFSRARDDRQSVGENRLRLLLSHVAVHGDPRHEIAVLLDFGRFHRPCLCLPVQPVAAAPFAHVDFS